MNNIFVKRNSKYRICISILILCSILRVFSACDFIFATPVNIPAHQGNEIITVSINSVDIDLNQADRKAWVAATGHEMSRGFNYRQLISPLVLYIVLLLTLIVDIRGRIMKCNVIKYNGSKYKGGCLLPTM